MVVMSRPAEKMRGTAEVRRSPLQAGFVVADSSVATKASMNSRLIELTGGEDMARVPIPDASSTLSVTIDRRERWWEEAEMFFKAEDEEGNDDDDDDENISGERIEVLMLALLLFTTDPRDRKQWRKAMTDACVLEI